MRLRLLVLAGMAACFAWSGTVTFSGKTPESIEASGGLTFEALEWQAYGTEDWASCGFMDKGAAWEDKTLFAPDANVQTAGRWRATFRATEALTLRQAVLTVRIHNSAGQTQVAGTRRTAVFRLSAGGAEAAATATLTGAGTLEAQRNEVALTFGEAVTVAEGELLTLVCERAEEALGCYFALSRLSLSSAEVTWRAEDGTVAWALGELPYNASFSLVAEIVAPTGEGTLLSLTGGGGKEGTPDVRKGLFCSFGEGGLVAEAAGKNGLPAGLLSVPAATGRVRVAFAVENAADGKGVTIRAAATGGAAGSGSQFNFDNTAHSAGAWGANAPFDAWALAPEVASLEVAVGTAWSAEELAARVSPPREVSVEGEVAWSEAMEGASLRFRGGTLTIPAGVTVRRLRLTEDSGAGALRVLGTLLGEDSGEPSTVAFPLPPEVPVALGEGAGLFMDGRLSAPVRVLGAASLGAASEGGTLTLDRLDLGAEAAPQAARGCVEAYRCRAFGTAEGAALRRWDCRGQRLRIR